MGSCDGMRKTAEALTVLEGKLEAAAVLEDRSSQSCQTFLTVKLRFLEPGTGIGGL